MLLVWARTAWPGCAQQNGRGRGLARADPAEGGLRVEVADHDGPALEDR